MVRQRRHRPGEGVRRGTGSRAGSSAGIGVTVAMQAMNGLDQLQPVEGMGPVGEFRLVPDLETFRVLPYAPHTRRGARRPARRSTASRRRSASARSSSA